MWSLGDTIVEFSLPRIKRMKLQEDDSDLVLMKRYDDLIEGLEIFIRDNGSRIYTPEEKEKVNKSLEDFGPMLPGMWC